MTKQKTKRKEEPCTQVSDATNKTATDADEVVRLVQKGFVPIISQTPGFNAYYAFVAGDGVIGSIRIFDDQSGVEESNRRAADWVKQNIAQLVAGSPQIMAGTVTVRQAS